jgi:Ricin-type beta-trefoil lectin domain-like
LPAHRRLERGAAASRRRTVVRGRRRASTDGHGYLALALSVMVLAAGAVAAPKLFGRGWSPGVLPDTARMRLAAIPNDSPEAGLVYEGLTPARAGSACAGAYDLITPDICTHGPDPAPPGLSVVRNTPAVTAPAAEPVPPQREMAPAPRDSAVIGDVGGIALVDERPGLVPDAAPGEAEFVMGQHDVACTGDGNTGKRIQVLYLHEFGTASRYAEYLGSFRAWTAEVDAIFDASARETGGVRHLRLVTTPQCEVDVAEVQVPRSALSTFPASVRALRMLGYNRTDRKYLIFADAHRYCGIASMVNDRRPGLGNRNNGGPSYSRVDAGCWGAQMATHELAHGLGAVLPEAPHSSRAGHCTDDYEVLCQHDSSEATVRVACPDKEHEWRLDCNHDDYFHTDPKPGTFLTAHWNMADSEFLLKGNSAPVSRDKAINPGGSAGTNQVARPGDTPAPPSDPQPGSPDDAVPQQGLEVDATRAATGAAETAQDGQTAAPPQDVVLQVRDATSTSVQIIWTPVAPGTQYAVAVDGDIVARTTATRGRLIGLRPDTSYRVQVMPVSDPRGGKIAAGEVRTPPAARPADGAWFVLTNSLTGAATDLYAARSADGAPLVLNRPEAGAQQQWKLVPVGTRAYQIQSRATGKCIAPQGNNPAFGVPVVQAECSSDDTAQRWRIQRTKHGFSVRTTVGDLVVGPGTQRFGGPRVLVLQHPDQARHQSWTALPG